MKPHDIKAGMFVMGKKGSRIREILHIGELSGFRDENVFYVDAQAGGFCGVPAIASWAACEVQRPADWVRPECDLVWLLHTGGKLPEQHGVAPPLDVVVSKQRSDLAKAIVYNAFRNTDLENIHSGTYPPPGSKVVTPDGTTIPWEEVSHISDQRMKALMINAVNKVYTMLSFPRLKFRHDVRWNEPEPDEELIATLALDGIFGEAARVEAFAKLDDRMTKKSNRDADPPMF
jgi:hypothetical protein